MAELPAALECLAGLKPAGGRPAAARTRGTRAPELGATLYVPANRVGLSRLLAGETIPSLRSVIVCLEDSVAEADLGSALDHLRQALARLAPVGPRRFLRPRHPANLAMVADFPGIELLDGFALPKINLSTLADYARILEKAPATPILPILETEEVFSSAKLEKIAESLARLPNEILAVRIGGNDILSRLGLRRPRGKTAYETPLREAIVRVLAVFRPRGYRVAAPVYEHFGDLETLRRETCQDVEHGLFTKAAIHPSQLAVIEGSYRPSLEELVEAQQILEVSSPAVFKLHGSMCEPATHRRWASEVIARAASFGVRCAAPGEP